MPIVVSFFDVCHFCQSFWLLLGVVNIIISERSDFDWSCCQNFLILNCCHRFLILVIFSSDCWTVGVIVGSFWLLSDRKILTTIRKFWEHLTTTSTIKTIDEQLQQSENSDNNRIAMSSYDNNQKILTTINKQKNLSAVIRRFWQQYTIIKKLRQVPRIVSTHPQHLP